MDITTPYVAIEIKSTCSILLNPIDKNRRATKEYGRHG
jgi:hypothetical protein